MKLDSRKKDIPKGDRNGESNLEVKGEGGWTNVGGRRP